MGKAGTRTATSGMEWNTMLGLSQRLRKDGNHRFQLLVTCGCYFGLRASDLLRLRWRDVLDRNDFTLVEQKTGKPRKITVNPAVREALVLVSKELAQKGRFDIDGYLFANRWGSPMSISYVNRQLHLIFARYRVKVQNPSTHTLRKTFGRRVWEMDGKSERALIYLSEIFSHSSIATTKRYIGVTEQQIADIYIRL